MARIDLVFTARGNFDALSNELQQVGKQMRLMGQLSAANGVKMQGAFTAFQRDLTRQGGVLDSIRGISHATMTATAPINDLSKALQKGKLNLNQFRSALRNMNEIATRQARLRNAQWLNFGQDIHGNRMGQLIIPDAVPKAADVAALRFRALGTTLSAFSTHVIDTGKNIQWAGRQITVGLSLPLGIAAYGAARAAEELNKMQVRLEKVFDTTGTAEQRAAQIRMLRVEFDELSESVASIGITPIQVREIGAEYAAAGYTIDTGLLQQTQRTIETMVLGEIELADATNLVRSTQANWGLTVNELADTLAKFNAIENATPLAMRDLATSLPEAAGALAQFNVTAEQGAVYLAAIREAGFDAGESAIALRQLFVKLAAPTQKSIDLFKEYGLNIEDIYARNKGQGAAIVEELSTFLQGIENGQARVQLLATLVESRQAIRINALIEQMEQATAGVNNAFAQGSEVLNMTREDAYRMQQRELRAIAESPSGRLQAARAEFQRLMSQIGEQLLDWLVEVRELINSVLNWFNNLSDGTRNLIVTLLAMVAALGPLTMFLGLFLNAAGQIMKVVLALWPKMNILTTSAAAQSIAFDNNARSIMNATTALGTYRLEMAMAASEMAVLTGNSAAFSGTQSALLAAGGGRRLGYHSDFATKGVPGTPGYQRGGAYVVGKDNFRRVSGGRGLISGTGADGRAINKLVSKTVADQIEAFLKSPAGMMIGQAVLMNGVVRNPLDINDVAEEERLRRRAAEADRSNRRAPSRFSAEGVRERAAERERLRNERRNARPTGFRGRLGTAGRWIRGAPAPIIGPPTPGPARVPLAQRAGRAAGVGWAGAKAGARGIGTALNLLLNPLKQAQVLVKGLTAAFAFMLTPIGALAIAIGAIVAIIGLIVWKWKDFMEGFNSMRDRFDLGEKMEAFKKVLDTVATEIASAFGLFTDGTASGAIGEFVNWLGKAAGWIAAHILPAVTWLVRLIGAQLANSIRVVVNIVKAIAELLSGDWRSALDYAKEAMKALGALLMESMLRAIVAVSGWLADLVDKIPGMGWLADGIRAGADAGERMIRVFESWRAPVRDVKKELDAMIPDEADQQLDDLRASFRAISTAARQNGIDIGNMSRKSIKGSKDLTKEQKRALMWSLDLRDAEVEAYQIRITLNKALAAAEAARARGDQQALHSILNNVSVLRSEYANAAEEVNELLKTGTDVGYPEYLANMPQAFGEVGKESMEEFAENAQAEADEWFAALRSAMGDVMSEIADVAGEAFDDWADKRTDAVDRAHEDAIKAIDDEILREQEKADAALKAIDDEAKAEEDLNRVREHMFRLEELRRNRAAGRIMAEIEYEYAIAEGNLAQAAIVRERAEGEEATYGDDLTKANADFAQEQADRAREARKAGIEEELADRVQQLEDEKILLDEEYEARKENVEKMIELRRRQFDKELEMWQKTTPKTKAEYQKQVQELGGILNRYGLETLPKIGNTYGVNMGNGFERGVADARAAIAEDAKWEAAGEAMATNAISAFQKQARKDARRAARGETVKATTTRAADTVPGGRDANGNAIPPQIMLQTGGPLPGYGGGDKIPAMLEPGEWVIRKESVKKFGDNFMAQVNQGELPVHKYETGGRAGFAQEMVSNIFRGQPIARDLRKTAKDIYEEYNPPAEAAGDVSGLLNENQAEVARIIWRVGQQLKATKRQMLAAFAAALVESGMRNLDHGHLDSLGVFQQRHTQGWGKPEDIMNVAYATRSFLQGRGSNNGAMDYPNWDGTIGALAQHVQRSAFPHKYQQRLAEAQSIYAAFSGVGNVSGESAALGTDKWFRRPRDRWPDPSYNSRVLAENTAAAQQTIQALWGNRLAYNSPGLDRMDPDSQHSFGKALDVSPPGPRQYPNAREEALGWTISRYFMKNAEQFGTWYAIWQGMINSGDGSGWRRYTRATDVTGGHYDHVHLSFLKQGGRVGIPLFKGAEILANNVPANLHKGETVLTAPLSQQLREGLDTLSAGGTMDIQNHYHIHGDVTEKNVKALAREITTIQTRELNRLGGDRKI